MAACSAAGPGTPLPQLAEHHRPPPPPPPPPLATGAPYPDVTFEDAGVNPYVDPQRDPLSTFAMDVDTASYSIARRFIEDGNLPPYEAVRLEEYVNSFDYGYQPPEEGAFAVHLDGGSTPFTDGRSVLLRIGIQAMTVADEERQPVSLTFVIDTSGSMQMENRLELVKDALGILVAGLRADDSVAIVEFGSRARVVLEPTSAAEPQVILDAIRRLTPGGSTNAQHGLELGYGLAVRARRPGTLDRVVLASDGVANVGLTGADGLLAQIDRHVEAGIELISVGVGMGNFNDVLLEQLANRGNGFYAYVNDRREADQLFGRNLTSALQTVARDAKVQVEFRADAVARYRLLGYENRALADDDFRDPTVDAGEVGAGHSVTALYELELYERGGDGHLGTVRLRWQDPGSSRESSLTADIELRDLAPDYESTDPDFQLAATVAAFAEILRESPHARGYDLLEVARQADALGRWFDRRDDVEEFRWLANRAAQLGDRGRDW
ncbi:MAG TPA: von Willebrand factor type A domain-containing protein [Candidatus Limnocylindria bacterium]|nr:von Willebrand factor type A domain-containing protein [Candidatus Limnocylindria bacterium]